MTTRRRVQVAAVASAMLVALSLAAVPAGAVAGGEATTGVASPARASAPAPAALAADAGDPSFTGVSPARLLDTRAGRSTVDGVGAGGGAFSDVRSLRVTGRGGIPASGVGAVVLNVTAAAPAVGGFLTVFPAGSTRPNASNVNYSRGATVATTVVAKVGTGGQVSIYASSRTDVLVDVAGWFAAGSAYTGLNPARLVDTRAGRATVDGVDAATGSYVGSRSVKVAGRGGVPGSGVGAVVLNVTAAAPTAGGYTTVFPGGEGRPNASNVNFVNGQTVANLVIAKVGPGGLVDVYNSVRSDVLVDVSGWFPTGSDYTGLTPARLVDTRPGRSTVTGGYAGAGAFGSMRSYQVTGKAGVPANAGVVILNVTTAEPVGAGYTTVFPNGASRPNASSLNSAKGQTVANLVAAEIGMGGQVSVYHSSPADLIVDVMGWLPGGASQPGEQFREGSISTGLAHTCAVTTAGAAKCWGGNWNGQLGDGTTTHRLTPVTVSGLGSGVASITTRNYHTCAVTTAGAAKCWGNNSYGELGDGTTTRRLTPVTVSGLGSGVASIDVGYYHTCAVTTAGAAKCWGWNGYGEVGDGTTTQRSAPVTVSGLGSGVAEISAGREHSCVVTTAGAARCWGRNAYREVGDGTNTQRLTPVTVSGLGSGAAGISAASAYSCAVTIAGAANCWGYNLDGQLGDGTTTNRPTPVTVSGLGSGVASISTGGSSSCVVTTAGAARCWGSNLYGKLGDGTTTQRLSPVTVSGLGSGATWISAASAHSCAVTTTGAARCWGSNSDGQLGIGAIQTVQYLPVTVTGLN